MAKLAIVVLAASLTACAHSRMDRPATGVRVEYQTIVQETQRPCDVERPKRPSDLARPLPADAKALAAVLGAKLAEFAGAGKYADQAEAVLDLCAKGE